MNRSWIGIGAVALVLVVGAGAYFIGTRHGTVNMAAERPRGIDLQGRPVIELGLAIEKATQLVPGDILKVELESEDDRYVYEVKVLAQSGRVREIKLDAQDGSMIEIEEE